jgi:hypothetical protein
MITKLMATVCVVAFGFFTERAKADERVLVCPSLMDISSFVEAGIVPERCTIRYVEASTIRHRVGTLQADYVAQFDGKLNRDAAKPTLYSLVMDDAWKYAIIDPVILPIPALEVSK